MKLRKTRVKRRPTAFRFGHNKKGPGRDPRRRRGASRLTTDVPYVKTLKHPHARKP